MTTDNFPIRKFSAKDIAPSFGKLLLETEGKVCDVIGTIVEAKFPFGRLGTFAEIDAGQD